MSAELKLETTFRESACFMKFMAIDGTNADLDRENSVITECNFHHAGPFGNSGKIIEIIESWRMYQTFLKDASDKFLFGELA